VYVDIDNKTVSVGNYDKYLWHKKYKVAKDNKGKYTGRIVKEYDNNSRCRNFVSKNRGRWI
jgi:hypothetical protein